MERRECVPCRVTLSAFPAEHGVACSYPSADDSMPREGILILHAYLCHKGVISAFVMED